MKTGADERFAPRGAHLRKARATIVATRRQSCRPLVQLSDSQAAREYQETCNKARDMLQAIDLAESG